METVSDNRPIIKENFPLVQWADSMPTSQTIVYRPERHGYMKIVVDVMVIYRGSSVWHMSKEFPLDTPLPDVMKCVEFFQKESNEYIRLKASEV